MRNIIRNTLTAILQFVLIWLTSLANPSIAQENDFLLKHENLSLEQLEENLEDLDLEEEQNEENLEDLEENKKTLSENDNASESLNNNENLQDENSQLINKDTEQNTNKKQEISIYQLNVNQRNIGEIIFNTNGQTNIKEWTIPTKELEKFINEDSLKNKTKESTISLGEILDNFNGENININEEETKIELRISPKFLRRQTIDLAKREKTISNITIKRPLASFLSYRSEIELNQNKDKTYINTNLDLNFNISGKNFEINNEMNFKISQNKTEFDIKSIELRLYPFEITNKPEGIYNEINIGYLNFNNLGRSSWEQRFNTELSSNQFLGLGFFLKKQSDYKYKNTASVRGISKNKGQINIYSNGQYLTTRSIEEGPYEIINIPTNRIVNIIEIEIKDENKLLQKDRYIRWVSPWNLAKNTWSIKGFLGWLKKRNTQEERIFSLNDYNKNIDSQIEAVWGMSTNLSLGMSLGTNQIASIVAFPSKIGAFQLTAGIQKKNNNEWDNLWSIYYISPLRNPYLRFSLKNNQGEMNASIYSGVRINKNNSLTLSYNKLERKINEISEQLNLNWQLRFNQEKFLNFYFSLSDKEFRIGSFISYTFGSPKTSRRNYMSFSFMNRKNNIDEYFQWQNYSPNLSDEKIHSLSLYRDRFTQNLFPALNYTLNLSSPLKLVYKQKESGNSFSVINTGTLSLFKNKIIFSPNTNNQIIQLNMPTSGITISRNSNQKIIASNENNILISQRIRDSNQIIKLDENTLPLNVSFETDELNLYLPYRGAYLLQWPANKNITYVGRINNKTINNMQSLELLSLNIFNEKQEKIKTSLLNNSGVFVIENLTTGNYTGIVESNKKEEICKIKINIKEENKGDEIINLGKFECN
ncbi:MAG: hypothetical protein QXX30_02000 [Candidatus Aenigmatarchaeota archaeon]